MKSKKITLFSTLVLAIAMLLPQFAMAASPLPSFSMQVSSSNLNKGDEFTVTIKGNDLVDLYAYELNLYYNAASLTFKPGSETTSLIGFNVPAKVSEQGGTHVLFAHTKTSTAAGDSGALDLVSFVFTAKESGLANISLKDIKIINSKLNMSLLPNTISKDIQVGPTTPSTNSGLPVSTPNSGAGDTTVETITVTADQLKDNGTNTVTIELKGASSELKLPGNTAELLGDKFLTVKAEGVKLELPASLFKQLKAQLTDEQLKDGIISLSVNTVPTNKELNLGTDAKIGGQIYEFKLQWKAADGSTYDLHQFDQPITIRMAVNPSVNPKLAAIYYLPEGGGVPERIGGKYADGEFAAQISHFSAYAVLEVNKLFTDVPDSFWASAVIKEMAAKEIISGTGGNLFEPNRKITRAEFTALMVRALQITEASSTAFEDVPASSWYAKDVSIAYKAGIIQGTSRSKFSPDVTITREEMAVLIVRSYELLKGKATAGSQSSFTDESIISAWSLESVQKAKALGLIQGRGAGEFVPKGSLTRAEAAQAIYRILNE
jgi:hypothetical protein